MQQLDCMSGQINYDEETAHQEIHQGINNYVAGMIMESRLKHMQNRGSKQDSRSIPKMMSGHKAN